MDSDREATLLREKLDAYLRDEAETRLALARMDSDADSLATMFARHAWLAGSSARDLLAELRDRGRIGEDEAIATASHFARFVRERELASVRTTLRAFPARRLDVSGEGVQFASIVSELYRGATTERETELGRVLSRAAVRALGPIREALDRGDEAAAPAERMSRPRDDAEAKRRSESRLVLVEEARRFLGATRDLRDEVLSFLSHAHGRPPELASLPVSLRFAALDDAVARATRARRFAELVAPLSMGRELGSRVRVETSAEGLAPRVATLVRTPTDVRLVSSTLELGLLSELSFLEAAGAALVRVLANPALPPAIARPIDASFARTIGRLFATIAFDARHLAHARRVPDRVLDRVRRAAAAIAILELRIRAAAILLDGRRDDDAAAERLDEAIGIRAPGPLAALILETPRTAHERFRAGTTALAATLALRDLYDEDYLENPRTAEHLRVAAGAGGATTAESFAVEIRADRALAPRRLADWFEGRA